MLLADHSHVDHDDLEHSAKRAHKGHQVEFFDNHASTEFEITRPRGGPRLYRWLLAEKFRRSVSPIEALMPGATALVVCGGSGMDAEFLCRSGACVITSDISLGAAKRAAERARRYGLPLLSIVADVEHLPLVDRSVDVVYVHDGLHHLKQPEIGLAEMSRVTSRGICITEPARAGITALAIRLGLAKEFEEPGNRVARLRLLDLTTELLANGFRVAHAERYAMYYRHQPGMIFEQLSRRGIFPLILLAWKLCNGVVGRFGNKLAVTGVRR